MGREPSWWYAGDGDGDGWAPRLLAPLGVAYGVVAGRRLRAPPRYRPLLPVIAIGNFTAGGTGKTPFVRVVVQALRDLGHAPVVLSRGYGGRAGDPHWVDPARDTADAVGDEPLLLAAGVPVVVARDRVAGARAIEAGGVAATVIVMDDGLQNPSLAKDLCFTVVDAARGFGNGRCIPAGPLRAPLAAQWPGVDAVVLNQGDGASPHAPGLDARIEACTGPILAATITTAESVLWLTGCPVIAFAGIGVPGRFFATLKAAGALVRHEIAFPDHHAYGEHDARRLLDLAMQSRATLVTTEKDYVRLRGRTGPLRDLAIATHCLPVTLTLPAAHYRQLGDLLTARLKSPPGAPGPPSGRAES